MSFKISFEFCTLSFEFTLMFKKFISKLQILFIPCAKNQYRPDFLQSNFLPYCLVFLFLLKFIIVPFLIYFPETNLFADISKTILVELTNNERKQLGLNSLKENSQLNQAALLKAQDILNNNYFSHYSPQGKSPWYWFGKANYNYKAAGENLGIGFLDSSEVHQAWNNSPTHKANLLSPNYQEIGIAVLQGNFEGNETTIVVQLFGSPTIKKETETKKEITPVESLAVAKKETATSIASIQEIKTQEEEISQTQTTTATTAAQKIVETTEQKVAGAEEQKEKTSAFFGLLKFMSTDYSNLTQKIAFYALAFAFLALLLNILIHIKIQHPDLIYKTVFCVFLLILYVLVDKNFIIQIIPHSFNIY